ncbi:MAG: hypothetical protein PHU23_09960 [Dehalococcoidales bacterium]|nr:hypothetical protein [Dehalococcoidales bacterium]
MVEGRESTERDEKQRAVIQVLGTNRDNPDKGRIFVWTKRGWFERVKDNSEGVAFEPVADSEDELKEYVSRNNSSAQLFELREKFRKRVAEEFSERSQSYQEAPQDWREKATDEDENQQYHQHD